MPLLEIVGQISDLVHNYGPTLVALVILFAMYYLSNKSHIKSLEQFNTQYVEAIVSIKDWLTEFKVDVEDAIDDCNKDLSTTIITKMDKLDNKLDAIIMNNTRRSDR